MYRAKFRIIVLNCSAIFYRRKLRGDGILKFVYFIRLASAVIFPFIMFMFIMLLNSGRRGGDLERTMTNYPLPYHS